MRKINWVKNTLIGMDKQIQSYNDRLPSEDEWNSIKDRLNRIVIDDTFLEGDWYTIKDSLDERAEDCYNEIIETFFNELDNDQKTEEGIDTLENIYDMIIESRYYDEMIDGAVPIYYSDIDDIWAIREDELIEAVENEGLRLEDFPNVKTGSIWCYIRQYITNMLDNEDKVKEDLKELIC